MLFGNFSQGFLRVCRIISKVVLECSVQVVGLRYQKERRKREVKERERREERGGGRKSGEICVQ